jgi:hypothetical protein
MPITPEKLKSEILKAVEDLGNRSSYVLLARI